MTSARRWVGGVAAALFVFGIVVFAGMKWFMEQQAQIAVMRTKSVIAEFTPAPEKAAPPKAPTALDEPARGVGESDADALFDRLEKLTDALRKSDLDGYFASYEPLFPGGKKSPKYERLDEYLGKAQELLTGSRQFSESAESFVRSRASEDFWTVGRHVQTCFDIGNLLTTNASHGLQKGDLSQFLPDVESAYRIANALKEAPAVECQRAYFNVCQKLFAVLQDAANAHALSVEAEKRIGSILPNGDLRDAFRQALAGSFAAELDFMDGLRTGRTTQALLEKWRRNVIDDPKLPAIQKVRASVLEHAFVSAWAAPIRDRMEQTYAEDVAWALKEVARPPYYEEKGDREKTATPGQFAYSVAELAKVEGKLDLTRIGLILEIYRAEKNLYPETLEEAPDLREVASTDPFTGKGYVYQLTSKGFILYSAGPDRTDDGGDSARDIVWRIGE